MMRVVRSFAQPQRETVRAVLVGLAKALAEGPAALPHQSQLAALPPVEAVGAAANEAERGAEGPEPEPESDDSEESVSEEDEEEHDGCSEGGGGSPGHTEAYDFARSHHIISGGSQNTGLMKLAALRSPRHHCDPLDPEPASPTTQPQQQQPRQRPRSHRRRKSRGRLLPGDSSGDSSGGAALKFAASRGALPGHCCDECGRRQPVHCGACGQVRAGVVHPTNLP